MLHKNHAYVSIFKHALENIALPDLKVIIRVDMRPAGEHEHRYNAPSVDEVAIILDNQQHGNRDIVLRQRCGSLNRISETHRAYNSLQYPLMFWKGQDGYNLSLRQIIPGSYEQTNKSVSCKDFYSYHFMIWEGNFNHLLRFDRLTCQLMVGVYAKIEAEHLFYLRRNQARLRAEQYVHLRDALINESSHPQNIGQPIILPSSFIGSPPYQLLNAHRML